MHDHDHATYDVMRRLSQWAEGDCFWQSGISVRQQLKLFANLLEISNNQKFSIGYGIDEPAGFESGVELLKVSIDNDSRSFRDDRVHKGSLSPGCGDRDKSIPT